MLEGGPSRQLRASGSAQVVAALQATRRTLRRVTASRLEHRAVLLNSRELSEYLLVHLGGLSVEEARVLYLDAGRRLISEEVAGRGTPHEVPLYVRTVLGRALQLDAAAIVIAHNHPSGSRAASASDVEVTRLLAAAGASVGICVLDHLIVARGRVTSIMSDVQRSPSVPPASHRDAAAPEIGSASRLSSPGPDGLVGGTDAGRDALRCGWNGEGGPPEGPDRVASCIRAMLKLRRRRDALFPARLLAEPGWDMLLDLYASELEGATLSAGSLSIGATAPMSTGMRCIRRLERHGLVERTTDELDRRRSLVRLTPAGRERMCRFAAIAGIRDVTWVAA